MSLNILYHLTSALPHIPETDAVFQEINTLKTRFSGTIINLYPLTKPHILFPRFLYGVKQAQQLKETEHSYNFHHIYHPLFYFFPVLKILRRPIIYSVVAGVQKSLRKKEVSLVDTIVISNERDETTLQAQNIKNYRLIRPGIKTSLFSFKECQQQSDFILMVGSAPWTARQFKQKGIDAILNVAAQMPNLKLIFLWRGLLEEELEYRIKKFNLMNRVEILKKKVNVNEILGRSHAAIVLAQTPKLVKAYPHSLMESLAAGKPVLISNTIPMADYVRQNNCGEIVSDVNAKSLKENIEKLMKNYNDHQTSALRVGQRDFSQTTMFSHFEKLYQEVSAKA
jgi:glycosyltransferase involved in cell wall biosynthesis